MRRRDRIDSRMSGSEHARARLRCWAEMFPSGGNVRFKKSSDAHSRPPDPEGAAMTEDPYVIRANIANYEAQLRLDLDDRKRATIRRLLAEAKLALVLVVNQKR
jgi:hypothetical protein